MTKASYTVAVGHNWHDVDGSPSPDYTCGHRHRTVEAARKCGERLYASRYVRGTWSANARWHAHYIVDNATGHKVPS